MNKIKKKPIELTESRWIALNYMKALIDVAREPFLILDARLRVISANPIFYQVFRVLPKQTENKFIYELGNNQWNIPKLKALLKRILPNKKIIKNYEVAHNFEKIGKRIMLFNAKQIDSLQLIIIALEDITDRRNFEKKLMDYNKDMETRIAERTRDLAYRIKELELVNKSMVGRELKMVKLKQDIEECGKKLKKSR